MKVLLRRNVSKLGNIGDVVEVKSGYARNYLLPQSLAMAPTKGNLKVIEEEKQAYLEQLARERAELEAKAQVIDGKEVTISARANEEGHLYGSVGPAQIVAALAADGMFVDPHDIVLDTPIRQLDKYEVQVRFSEDVAATVGVWIVPTHEEGEEAQDAPPAENAQADRTGDEDQPADAEDADATDQSPA